MKDARFNLINEPWIKIIDIYGEEKLYCLRDLFLHSHEIKSIAGETELQDNAILRLLISINSTCIYRYDEDAKENELEDEDEAINRYKTILDEASFPVTVIDKYFEKWRDRFYLIGGEYPFYQVPTKYLKEIDDSKNKSKNPSCKTYLLPPYKDSDKLGWIYPYSFNGEILQSGNTSAPFANKNGDLKNNMSFAEAARWLIYYMNYSDCSSKIPGKWNAGMTFTSSGANIHPIGRNLFETIMLCTPLLNVDGLLYGKPKPIWERDDFSGINQSPYGDTCPDNIPELYTQQSRKVVLHSSSDIVDGMYTAAGDRYGTVNAFNEPMFAFHADLSDKSGSTKRPSHMKSDSTGWKEFKNIFGGESGNPTRWVEYLINEDIISDDVNIPYVMSDISYGSMQCGVDYTVSSSITVNGKFFIDSAELEKAKKEVDYISKISFYLNKFGQDIDQAYGAKADKKGMLNSSIGDRMSSEYELLAGADFQQYLINHISLDDLHESEIKYAARVSDKVLTQLNILGIVGHGDKSIGSAEYTFNKNMWYMKNELGLLRKEENAI